MSLATVQIESGSLAVNGQAQETELQGKMKRKPSDLKDKRRSSWVKGRIRNRIEE